MPRYFSILSRLVLIFLSIFKCILSQVVRMRGQVVWVVMLVFGLLLTLHIFHLLFSMFLPWRDLSILFDEDDLGIWVDLIKYQDRNRGTIDLICATLMQQNQDTINHTSEGCIYIWCFGHNIIPVTKGFFLPSL